MSSTFEPYPSDRPALSEQRWRTHRRYLYLLAKLLFVGIVAALAWRVASVLSAILMPALVGLLFAYLLDPVIDVFERRRIRRSAAIAVLAVVLSLAVALLAFFIVPAFLDQFIVTVQRLPDWVEALYRQVSYVARERLGYSGQEIEAVTRKLLVSLQGTLLRAVTGVGSSVDAILNTLLIPLFFFYFLRDFDRIKHRPLALVPPRYHDYVLSRARTMDRLVGGWVRGQVQVALLLAVLYAAGLALVGVRLGVVIGIVAGLFNIVPYFGAAIGIALAVLMVLLEHQGWQSFLAVGLVFLTVQVLEGYVLTPRLVGSKVGMPPLLVIAVVLVGGSLFGLVGMLLAVPVTAALGVLLQDALAQYRRSDFWTGGKE